MNNEEKIGMYTSDEIYDKLANGFLQRSMVDAMYFKIKELQQKVNQLESTLNEVRAIVSKSVFKTDLVELCRMKNQIKEVLDKVGGSNE